MASAQEQKLSDALDVIGQHIGGILVRYPEGWRVLPPGNEWDVLVINADGIPEWRPPHEVNP